MRYINEIKTGLNKTLNNSKTKDDKKDRKQVGQTLINSMFVFSLMITTASITIYISLTSMRIYKTLQQNDKIINENNAVSLFINGNDIFFSGSEEEKANFVKKAERMAEEIAALKV